MKMKSFMKMKENEMKINEHENFHETFSWKVSEMKPLDFLVPEENGSYYVAILFRSLFYSVEVNYRCAQS